MDASSDGVYWGGKKNDIGLPYMCGIFDFLWQNTFAIKEHPKQTICALGSSSHSSVSLIGWSWKRATLQLYADIVPYSSPLSVQIPLIRPFSVQLKMLGAVPPR